MFTNTNTNLSLPSADVGSKASEILCFKFIKLLLSVLFGQSVFNKKLCQRPRFLFSCVHLCKLEVRFRKLRKRFNQKPASGSICQTRRPFFPLEHLPPKECTHTIRFLILENLTNFEINHRIIYTFHSSQMWPLSISEQKFR